MTELILDMTEFPPSLSEFTPGLNLYRGSIYTSHVKIYTHTLMPSEKLLLCAFCADGDSTISILIFKWLGPEQLTLWKVSTMDFTTD